MKMEKKLKTNIKNKFTFTLTASPVRTFDMFFFESASNLLKLLLWNKENEEFNIKTEKNENKMKQNKIKI